MRAHGHHYHDGTITDVSFEAYISLWYCLPIIAAGLIGLGSLAAGAAIGAIIAASIAKHKYKKDDGGYGGGYEYDYEGGYDEGYHHRRKGGNDEFDVMELARRSFDKNLKIPFLKTFFRTKRSAQFQSHAKMKHALKKSKQILPSKLSRQQEQNFHNEQPEIQVPDIDDLRCGERFVCEVADVISRQLSDVQRQVLHSVWAGEAQFDRPAPRGTLALYQRAAALGARGGACATAYGSCDMGALALVRRVAMGGAR